MGFRLDFLAGHLSENMAYGHQANFARDCGLDTGKLRIYGRYQHGFAVYPYFPDSRIRGFVWSNEMKMMCESDGLRDIWSIGSPIIYWQDQLKLEVKSTNIEEYSLCIAPHSNFDTQQTVFETDEYRMFFPNFKGSDALHHFANLCLSNSSFDPTVLLYFTDFKENVVKRFASYGIKVLTLGDGIYDLNAVETYFDRKMGLLRDASEVLISDTNSIWAYAGYLGKPIKVFDESNFNNSISRLKSIFGDYELCDPELFYRINGLSDLKTPEELVEIFGSNDLRNVLRNQLNFVYESARRAVAFKRFYA